MHMCMGMKEHQNLSCRRSSFKGLNNGGKRNWVHRHLRSIIFTFLLVGFLYFLDSFLFSIFYGSRSVLHISGIAKKSSKLLVVSKDKSIKEKVGEKGIEMYSQLLNQAKIQAKNSLVEGESENYASKFLKESNPQAALWRPCADKKIKSKGKSRNSTGFIVVSANGGLNQQRVAVCNAVAVAYLLNATLIIPKFLYSNVWKDPSQFSDIYQEDYFINTLKNDVVILKELPSHFKLNDLEANGSLVTDADITKEATPHEYITNILPILSRNKVVHFLGFGNRLGFDPIPIELQTLRCKCNFHALKFVPKIQQTASLLISRIRGNNIKKTNMLEEQLVGNFGQQHMTMIRVEGPPSSSQYLALHLRFEIDMVAYSMCDFGGGESERRELEEYREGHFRLFMERLKNSSEQLSPSDLRRIGRCPLTPEEISLVLAALGFNKDTYIYLAGSHIYGGESRMIPLTTLYPKLVTKEHLLSTNELAPFHNFSSQLAALDFIVCAASDVFSMTDSGSQLSSLVSGFRTYYGNGRAPNLTPNHKRLAEIMLQNRTIGWKRFEEKIKKMIDEGQKARVRSYKQSVYRMPRCKGCMCKNH